MNHRSSHIAPDTLHDRRSPSADLSLNDLAFQITELAGHLNAANHRWLMLIAEFDRRNGWSDWGTQSCAHWLNWKCGIDIGAAREKVRVAHALQSLPKISAAMARGELSYSKARAMTRVATPATEDYLLMIARHGTAQHVEETVRHFRNALDAEELAKEARQQKQRALTYSYDDCGSLILKARLPAEIGAVVIKALDAAMESVQPNEEDVAAEEIRLSDKERVKKVPRRVQRADAIGVLAESFLQNGAAELSGGDKHQIVVHVSAETLNDRSAGRCELEEGPGISAETCRRHACDCSLVHITEDENGTPLDIGRKTRTIPPSIRRALNSRDKGCRFPGCCNKKFVDGHHIKHWANGGETRLSNLVSLCRFHHRLVHEGGVEVLV
ncbi:MAG TPA: DUF222 domain-containing protein, partial [Steroidobacteraceae bacterium]|nr:DUF222 domain-containing protein [Steroidobacteraceae bacterium]